jgi:hypothetical protein
MDIGFLSKWWCTIKIITTERGEYSFLPLPAAKAIGTAEIVRGDGTIPAAFG